MQPIRWDNVGAPSIAEASRPLEVASRTFNDAFASLRDTLQSREAIDTANWQNHKNINTTEFLDTVAQKYKSPEALAAAQADGSLDQLRQSFGNQIDADKVRGAADQRMASLMQQSKDKIAYQNVMRDENAAPFVDQLRASIVTGDKDGEAKARAGLTSVGYRNMADQDLFAEQHARTLVERQHADVEFDRSGRRLDSDIKHQRATEASQAVQAQAAASSAATQGKLADYTITTGTEDRKTAKAAGQAAALMGSLAKAGNLYAEGIYTGNQADELRKFMKDNNVGGGNSDKQAEVINYLGDILKKGVDIKGPDGKVVQTVHELPMAAVKQAVGGATNDIWNVGWNTAPAKNMRDALTSILSETSKDASGALRSRVLDDLRAYTDATQRVTENAAPIRSQGTPIVHSAGRRK